MAKVKTFYSKKGDRNWTNIERSGITPKYVQLTEHLDLIEIVMQLVTLFGLIFKVKVPALIFVNQIKYGLSIKYLESNQVIVGYSDSKGQFFIQFEDESEKKAKKALAEFLKSKGIV